MSQIDDFLNGKPAPSQPEQATNPKSANTSAVDDFLKGGSDPGRSVGDYARDAAAWAAKGAIAVPEAAVGLADLATGGHVGKFLENKDGAIGFRPEEARSAINDWHSDATKAAQRKFQEAEGIGGKFKAAIENPSNIVGAIAESVPSMLAGGAVARGISAATKLGQMGASGARVASALGEGVVGGGAAAEQIRQQTDDGLLGPQQLAAGVGTAAATAGFSLLGGRVAGKLGIGDADTMLAQGAKEAFNPLNGVSAKSIPRQMIEGAISEGLLEELPQSVSEQLLQNLALNKPWSEGVDEAIVMGALSGGAMGAGAAGLHGIGTPKGKADAPEATPDKPIPTGNPLIDGGAPAADPATPDLAAEARAAARSRARALGEEELARDMGPQSEPPDGAAALAKQQAAIEAERVARMERDRAIESPDDEIYQSTGAVVPAVKPSETMGIDPAAGGLSKAAALGVDAVAEQSPQRNRLTPEEEAGLASTLAGSDLEKSSINGMNADQLQVQLQLVQQRALENGSWNVPLMGQRRRIEEAMAKLQPTPPIESQPATTEGPNSVTQTNQAQQIRAESTQAGGAQTPSVQRDSTGGVAKASTAGSKDQQGAGATARGGQSVGPTGARSDASHQQASTGLNTNAPTTQNTGAQAAPAGSAQAQAQVTGEDRAREIAREGNEARRQRTVEASAEWTRMTEAQRQAAAAQAQGLNPVAKKSIHTRAWADLNQKHRDALVDVVARRQAEQVEAQTPASPAMETPSEQIQQQSDTPVQVASQPGSATDLRAIVAKQLPDMTTDELRQAATHYGPEHKRTAKIEKELAKRGESTASPVADSVAQSAPVAKEIEGRDLGDGWAEYSPDSGTKGIPRAEMPQIKAEHRGAMTNFMNARGIAHQEETVQATSLKPTQAEFSREKVEKAKNFEGGNRAILVSRDGHVLDGHHQWMAAREKGDDVRVIRLDAPIDDLVKAAHEFPSSTVDMKSPAPAMDKPKPRGVAGKLQAAREQKLADEKARDDAEDKARRDYFTPGNVVHAYGGTFDRVIDYKEPHERNNWAVTVRSVEKIDGKWVDVPGEVNRTHWTRPSDREIKAGPLERAEVSAPVSDAEQVLRDEIAKLRGATDAQVKSVDAPIKSQPEASKQPKKAEKHSSTENAPREVKPQSQKSEEDRFSGDKLFTVDRVAAARERKKMPSAEQTRAKADLMSALADLGDILGKNARMNMMPEQEQKLLPVLTRVLDAAFRMGYHKFKDSAKFALEQIREHIGGDAADALTLDHLQGAYIAMAGGKPGADTKRAVIDVETKAEIEQHTATAVQEQADTTQEVVTNERTTVQSDGPQALERVVAGEGQGVEGNGRARIDTASGGNERTEPGAGADAAGVQSPRSGGSRTERVHSAETGAGTGDRGRKSGRVKADPAKAAAEKAIGKDTRPEVAGEPASAPNIPAADFQITDDTRLGQGGEVQKFNDNLSAIRTLKSIEDQNRRATPDEQAALARYVGWGGLANAFPDPLTGKFKPAWEARGNELRELLGDTEYAAARRSTRNAHYTSKPVVQAMWRAVERLGFKGGLALETSMGVGNFLGLKPQDTPASFVGVEYDSLTSRIAQALYPQATVLHSGFQNVPLADNAFALSIGNPPFGSESLRFQYKPELNGTSIHNQFFRASMDALRPGGIQAMVVSRFLMDAKDKSTRLALAKQSKLIAAIRLPDTAFKENARTEVVTDIIILQKLTPAEQAEMTSAVDAYLQRPEKNAQAEQERKALASKVPAWVETAEVADPLGGEAMTVNGYFRDNKDNIIGVMERSGSMQHGADLTVRLDDAASLESRLNAVVDGLPQNIQDFGAEVLADTAQRHKSMSDALRIALAGQEVGHVQLNRDGKIERVVERETPEGGIEMGMQVITADSPWSDQLMQDDKGRWYRTEVVMGADGKAVKELKADGSPSRNNLTQRVTYANEADVPESLRLGKTGFERLQAAVGLRDSLKRQITLETADAAKGVMEANRKELAKRYADFVKKFGPVNRPANLNLIMTMPDGGLTAALEVAYQPEVTAARARTSGLPQTAEVAKPAPILTSRVVPKYEPATTADSPSDALVITLSERGRVDMDRIAELRSVSVEEAAEQLQTGDKPLVFKDPESEQWETADAYLSGNVRRKLNAARAARMDANVKALEAVQPAAWGAEDVTVMLGSTWVPPKVYSDFADHLSGGKSKASFSAATNSFSLTINNQTKAADEWSSQGAPVQYILSRLMNSQPVVVMYKDENGSLKRDTEATALAQLKAKEIGAEFLDWVFKDGERRTALVDLFNEKYNTRVVRQRDGSHLQLPGKVPDSIIGMRRHQKNVIWRGITDNALLMDHAVGAGKTFAAIARAMERRRMGLSKKPMIVVPNHLIDQWASDVYRLYPGAKVLAAGKKDFETKRRRRLFGKIATGDWDIVLVPHSSFGFIGIDPSTEQRFLQMEMNQALEAVKDAEDQAAEDGTDNGRRKPFGVKEAERLVEKIQTRMDKLNSGPRDRLLTFEQLGVDDLTVDEAHEFKNLYYSSRMTGVRGMGDKTGSRKANDLYNKVRVLQENPANAVSFLTGTPISNSAVEMYTVMRYLAPQQLKEMGLEHFDAWRAQFVEASAAFEPTESGSLKEVTRLGRSWSNMRSLMDLYYEFTDAVSLEDIQRWYSEDNGGKAFPVPKVKGGDRQLVNVQPTPAQETMLKEVIQGFDALPDIKDPYERNAERLRLMDRARKVSLDVRAVDPSSTSTEEGGKLAQASANIKRIYDATSADLGTQMVFLDRSVPKARGDDKIIKEYDALIAKRDEALAKSDDAAFQNVQEALDRYDANEISELRNAQNSGWNAYQQIKDNLVALGIPANEIRFIQEANNDEQKQALFDAVNGGKVRVLFGSSQRMGAGTNAQKRLVGLHHIDVTWKPSDIEQREGRIIRQGNELLAKYGDKFEVEIMAYATERTVDAKMWDLNATKLKTINGIRKYDGAFSMDFEDADSVSMAEMAALASGNPLLLERVKTESELNMLELQERAFRRKMYGAQDAVQDAERTIARNPDRIKEARANESRAQQAMDGAYSRQAARTVDVEGKTFTKLSDAYGAAKEATELQQGGKPNARYAVSVNGHRLTSKDSIESAISESLGDASVFEATIGGKDVFQRVGAARELVTEMNKLTAGMVAGDSRSKVVGKMLGFDLALDANAFEAGSAGTLIDSSVSLVDASGATVLSIGVSEVAANQTFVTANLRNPVSDLFQGVERMATRNDAAYLQKQLDRATKELPELRERLNQTFPKAEELTTKRSRLRELVSLLDADNKSVQVAQSMDVASDNAETDQASTDDQDDVHAGVRRNQAGQGSRVDRAVIGMVREGKNARDILRFVADASTSRFNRQVARLLLKSEAMPTVGIVGDLGSSNGFKHLAKYNRTANALSLTDGAQSMAEQIFLHEMIHAATLKALDKKGVIALQMQALFRHVQKQGGAAGAYGMKNVGEFVAEAFTNPEFQRALKAMSAPPGNVLKSAWDGFVRILKTILGLPAKSNDALSRALELGVQVMREDKAMRQREARESAALAAAREFLDGVPVASMTGDEVPKLGAQSLLVTWAAKHFEKETVDGAVKHPVLGEIKLDRRSAKDSLSHGYGKNKVQALYILPEVLPRARILSEESRVEGQSGYVLGAPVEIGGQPYIVAMVVKKHEGRTGLYVHEVVLRERLQEAINTGAPAQANQAGQSSRGNPGAIRSVLQKIYSVKSASPNADANFGMDDDHFFGAADLRGIKKSAMDQINQTFTHEGKVSRWFKTVGTMGHLAKLNPAFKPVFDSAQQFNDDISMMANDSANHAPRLIPRVEGLGDIIGKNRKTPVSAADNKAVAKPLFEGTLLWTRDIDGKPILAEDKAKKYANISADEKAQMMLKVGKIDASVLNMWKGQPLEHYENLINSRFESKMLKPGIVWTEAELKSMFKMNDEQVGLYREARTTIDRSIDMTARADMLRAAGEHYEPMRDAVLEATSLSDALTLLVETMEEEAKANPEIRDRLADVIQVMRNRFEDANRLKEEGYAPLQRYGRYTVDVVDKDGVRQYFGMFETARDSNQMALRMKSVFPGAAVTSGTMSEQAFKLFQGVTPETLERFGEMLGLKAEGNEAQDKAFQEYLKLTKNNHSALKRLIHRKGIEGYSEDVGRVLASFVYSNARLAAGGLNVGTMDKAINDIPKEQGELRDVAMSLRSYIQDPQEEGQAIRGMLFAQYLGGSLASAFVNLTQPFAVTMPWLSQYGGMKKAGAAMAKAFKDMSTKGFKYEADLANELKKAEDDGVVSPQEIHFLMAQARGAGTLRSGDGTKTGEARAAVANSWEKAKLLWGQPFAIAEQINRRSTFIAAYRTAKEQGMADPAEFARRAVIETQFQYSKANKPKWARGAVGGTLFTFKTYSVSYLELMHRMWTQGGKEGRRAVAWAAVMLLLMGGSGGLPFMEDLEDLIDGAGQLMGYNISSKQWRKQLLRDVVGKELGDFLDQGLSGLPGAPIDVSGRLGMGNLIPGTGLFLSKPNRERDLMEVVGPAGDLVSRGFTAARQVLKGDVGGAALQISPTAVRNAAKGIDMAVSGMYKDTKGYKVLDTTLTEAASKFIGFQPRSVAEVQEGNSFMMRSKSFYSQQSAEIKAQWADALFRKDQDDVQKVRERLSKWNRDNPEQPIRVNMTDVWKRVREMNKDRTQRIADTAPKALRQQMREIAKEM